MSRQVILYVEDDNLSREIMEMLFDDFPEYELIMYADSQDFESKLTGLPDELSLVLLDIHVQPYSGFEMLKMIRQVDRFRAVPIFALTASVMNEEINRLRQDGFNGAIAKPIDQDQFGDYIKDAISGKAIWTILSSFD